MNLPKKLVLIGKPNVIKEKSLFCSDHGRKRKYCHYFIFWTKFGSMPTPSRIRPMGVCLVKPSTLLTLVNLFITFRILKKKENNNNLSPDVQVKQNDMQVNLCQKHSFLNHLTHNMKTNCSLITEFSTRKIQVQNMLCTKIVLNAKTKTKTKILYCIV